MKENAHSEKIFSEQPCLEEYLCTTASFFISHEITREVYVGPCRTSIPPKKNYMMIGRVLSTRQQQ